MWNTFTVGCASSVASMPAFLDNVWYENLHAMVRPVRQSLDATHLHVPAWNSSRSFRNCIMKFGQHA